MMAWLPRVHSLGASGTWGLVQQSSERQAWEGARLHGEPDPSVAPTRLGFLPRWAPVGPELGCPGPVLGALPSGRAAFQPCHSSVGRPCCCGVCPAGCPALGSEPLSPCACPALPGRASDSYHEL